MARVTLLYFASLRDAAGMASESVDTDALDLQALYLEVQARHGLPLSCAQLRVAVGTEFASWNAAVPDGAEVAFLPPVSGG
jgi:molybdopterin synthase sulfur carrier subunit